MMKRISHKAMSMLCRALLGSLIGCSTAVVTPTAVVPPNTVAPVTAPLTVIVPTKPVQITKASVVEPAVSLPAYLLHLPGIGGKRSIDVAMTAGFRQGGFGGDIDIYDWTEKDPGMRSLISTERNHKEAKLIAAMLTERYDKDPTAPIYVTSHSGGGGLAVWTLEDLPDRVKINSLVMMSPALSPNYDLTKALNHVTGKVYVFSSQEDVLVLGTGCKLFGTIDGVKTDAAGRVGFCKPSTASDLQYLKIVPMPYRQDWVRYGDYGNHVGGMTHLFGQMVLAPLLLSGKMPAEALDAPATQPVQKFNLVR